MNFKIISLFGIIAPIIFVITIIVGGLITSGYSHLSQSVSELVMSGAPNNSIWIFRLALIMYFHVFLALGYL